MQNISSGNHDDQFLLVTAHLTAGTSALTVAGVEIVTKLLPERGIIDSPNSPMKILV